VVDAIQSSEGPTPRPTGAPGFGRRLLRRPVAVLCLAYLAIVAAVAVIAPLALPKVASQHAGDLLKTRHGPSSDHWLGTDSLGRDVLDRLLVGTQITVVGVLEAVAVVIFLGVPLGLLAGYLGGRIDAIVGWLADLTFSMPAFILILVVVAVFPHSGLAAMATLGVITAPSLMRVVRSATFDIRGESYIAAAEVAGLSRVYIISRHVFPRIKGPIIVQLALVAASALLVQTGLAFLNLVVPAPAPSWGGIVADGIQNISQQPWLIWPGGIATTVTVLALCLLADAVRDASTESWSALRHTSRRRTVWRPTGHAAKPTQQQSLAQNDGGLLRVEDLSVHFGSASSRQTVLDRVSFSMGAGEIVGLVGESGCGKTTTAMSILGLLPANGQISSGRILFEGLDLSSSTESQMGTLRGKKIGLVSQEPMISLNPALRVGSQLVELVRQHRDLRKREARSEVLRLLEQVRLPDPGAVVRAYPHELSGGMAQRVAIARALAGRPRLLIADEPTTALDVTVQAEILDLLRVLQAERGLAVLLVTHDWGVVADICERAVIMYAGQVVEEADTESLFWRPRHPYTEALLRANPHGTDTARLPTIPGSVPDPTNWPTGCHFADRCSYVTSACREGPIPIESVAPGRDTRCIRSTSIYAHESRESVGR
jgi:peptide/nickel transport system permease protein